ncbi:MAG: hypothetical protein ACI4MH_06970 [Candidatus Coproplasma sp.]
MIIAIKEKDRVVVCYSGGDGLSGYSDEEYVDEENVAIKFAGNGTLFACAKACRSSDILLYNDEFLNTDFNPQNVVREIIPFIKKTLQDNYQKIEEGQWNNCLLICNDRTVYDVTPMFSFREIEDYVCHGYFMETVIGVLDETVGLPAEERIIRAVTLYGKVWKESLFPLVITDTKSRKFKCIFEGETGK